MKNKFLILIAISSLFMTACRTNDVITPGDGDQNTSGDYQPFTRDSHWEYKTTTNIPGTNGQTDVEKSTITMTSGLYMFDNKSYHQAKSSSDSDPNKVDVFYGLNNHIYSMRQEDAYTSSDLDVPYLDDTAAVGANWTTAINTGTAVQMQVKTTIMKKGISKSIQGKTYTNVIHTQADLQYKINNVYQTTFTYEFYVAKNVGMIAVYVKTPSGDLAATELTSYTIK